jgi:hypothetical protein
MEKRRIKGEMKNSHEYKYDAEIALFLSEFSLNK